MIFEVPPNDIGQGQLMSQSSGLRYRASPAGEKNQAASGQEKFSLNAVDGFHRFVWFADTEILPVVCFSPILIF